MRLNIILGFQFGEVKTWTKWLSLLRGSRNGYTRLYATLSNPLSLHPSLVQLSTLFSNTISLCSYLNVRDQVSLSYKSTGKIKLYFCIFKFFVFDSRRGDKGFWTKWQQVTLEFLYILI
jgi:hypothetical protein